MNGRRSSEEPAGSFTYLYSAKTYSLHDMAPNSVALTDTIRNIATRQNYLLLIDMTAAQKSLLEVLIKHRRNWSCLSINIMQQCTVFMLEPQQ